MNKRPDTRRLDRQVRGRKTYEVIPLCFYNISVWPGKW